MNALAAKIVRYARSRQLLTLSLLIALCCSVANILFNDHIGDDTAGFYTRMAREIAAGNYARAYFHSMPPLMPTLAGLLGKSGIDPWTAMKTVSCIFFIGATVWAYRLARLRLSPQQAQWCPLLYVACSRLLRYGMAGQLDAGKMFFLLLAFEGALRFVIRARWQYLVQAALGGTCLALTRNEGVVYLPLLMVLIFSRERLTTSTADNFSRRQFSLGAARAGLVLGIFAIMSSPWIYYQYQVTGYPLLSSKQIPVLRRILPISVIEQDPCADAVRAHRRQTLAYGLCRDDPAVEPDAETQDATLGDWLSQFQDPAVGSVPYKLKEMLKGVYLRYAVFALVGIVALILRRQWKLFDTLNGIILAYHLLSHWVLLPNIEKRLIVPAIPFYFPWVIIAFSTGLTRSRLRLPAVLVRRARNLGVVAVGLAFALSIGAGMSSVRETLRGADRVERDIGTWIRDNRDRLDTNADNRQQSSLLPWGYHDGRQPVILTDRPQIVYWANGDREPLIGMYRGAQHQQVVDLCRFRKVDLIIVDADFLQAFSGFDPDGPQISMMTDQWEDAGILVYAFNPGAN